MSARTIKNPATVSGQGNLASASLTLSNTVNCVLTSNASGDLLVGGEPVGGGSVGPQGPQGEQGIQGEQGAQGDQGIQGIQGDAGSQGIQGDAGSQGIQGIQGDQGIQGIQGEQGVQGVQGVAGVNNVGMYNGTSGNLSLVPGQSQTNFFTLTNFVGSDASAYFVQSNTLNVTSVNADIIKSAYWTSADGTNTTVQVSFYNGSLSTYNGAGTISIIGVNQP